MKGNIMKLKNILCGALAAAMLASLCGCSVKVGTNRKVKDDHVVAAPAAQAYKDNDALEITYLDFKKEYVYYLKSRGITDDTAEDVAAECRERRASIINYLINEKIILDKAKQMGLDTLSDEEMSAVEKDYEEKIAEQIEYFGERADYGTLESGEVISDELKLERGGEELDKYLDECFLTRDDLLMWQVSAAVSDKVAAEVTKDVSVDSAEAETQFNAYVDSIKQLYADNPAEYEQGYYSAYWVPEGARRIKHILLAFEDKAADEIASLRRSGDDAGADSLRSQKAEEMEQSVTEVMDKLDGGADFDELITTMSADLTGSSMNPDGYLVIPGSTMYMEEFTEAAFLLEEVGDYRTAVTDYGVHIMLYASDAVVTDEEKSTYIDVIREQLEENEKNKVFSETLEAWKNEYSYETDHEALRTDAPSGAGGAASDEAAQTAQ